MAAAAFATLGLGFAFAPGLRAFVMFTAAALSQNTSLLHFTLKLLQCNIKGTTGIYNYLTHSGYQRDLPALLERLVRGW